MLFLIFDKRMSKPFSRSTLENKYHRITHTDRKTVLKFCSSIDVSCRFHHSAGRCVMSMSKNIIFHYEDEIQLSSDDSCTPNSDHSAMSRTSNITHIFKRFHSSVLHCVCFLWFSVLFYTRQWLFYIKRGSDTPI